MLWYQRSPEDTIMKLIGYLNFQTATMEEPYKETFNISGDLGGDKTKNGSLVTQVTGLETGAVYYCAACKAHWLKSPLNLTKTLHTTLVFNKPEKQETRVFTRHFLFSAFCILIIIIIIILLM